MINKLKLAYFSPLNPVQSGISDYSEELLPALAHYADIDLYLDDYQPTNRQLAGQFNIYPASKFNRQAGRYDSYLFHMGNSAAHAYIYRELVQQTGKGVLVLHDFVLHHFQIGQYLNRGRAAEYIRQMGKRYGPHGESTARQVIKGKLAEALFDYPLNEDAIEAARAVLVHSQYARRMIERAYPAKPVGVARMGVPLPPLLDRSAARNRLGLAHDEFIIVSLGHLNPYKRLDSALWAFKALRREFPRSRFVLVGSESPNYNVRAMIQALALEGSVDLVGYAETQTAADYLAAADCCINLRYPSAGETSASLLRIMGAGRPVMISRTGAFEELPDDTCIKVDVDDAEEELLLEYLRLLARRPDLGQAIGANARRYVSRSARLEDAAHDYYRFLCQLLSRPAEIEPALPATIEPAEEQLPPVKTRYDAKNLPATGPALVGGETENSLSLLQEIAQAAAEIGLAEDDPALLEIARASRFSGPL